MTAIYNENRVSTKFSVNTRYFCSYGYFLPADLTSCPFRRLPALVVHLL